MQSALKYFKNTEVDIPNILIMTGDFNIRDSFWDSLYLHNSIHSDLLLDIMDSLLLGLLYSTNSVSTRYSDGNQSSNLVINLIFLRYSSEELDNYSIYPEWRLLSDYALLTITISFEEQYIHNGKHSFAKDSVEENTFIKDMIKDFTAIDHQHLQSNRHQVT